MVGRVWPTNFLHSAMALSMDEFLKKARVTFWESGQESLVDSQCSRAPGDCAHGVRRGQQCIVNRSGHIVSVHPVSVVDSGFWMSDFYGRGVRMLICGQFQAGAGKVFVKQCSMTICRNL